jgi:hypothetical protein
MFGGDSPVMMTSEGVHISNIVLYIVVAIFLIWLIGVILKGSTWAGHTVKGIKDKFDGGAIFPNKSWRGRFVGDQSTMGVGYVQAGDNELLRGIYSTVSQKDMDNTDGNLLQIFEGQNREGFANLKNQSCCGGNPFGSDERLLRESS